MVEVLIDIGALMLPLALPRWRCARVSPRVAASGSSVEGSLSGVSGPDAARRASELDTFPYLYTLTRTFRGRVPGRGSRHVCGARGGGVTQSKESGDFSETSGDAVSGRPRRAALEAWFEL